MLQSSAPDFLVSPEACTTRLTLFVGLFPMVPLCHEEAGSAERKGQKGRKSEVQRCVDGFEKKGEMASIDLTDWLDYPASRTFESAFFLFGCEQAGWLAPQRRLVCTGCTCAPSFPLCEKLSSLVARRTRRTSRTAREEPLRAVRQNAAANGSVVVAAKVNQTCPELNIAASLPAAPILGVSFSGPAV